VVVEVSDSPMSRLQQRNLSMSDKALLKLAVVFEVSDSPMSRLQESSLDMSGLALLKLGHGC
jgi:hypothetical protein